MADAIRAVKDQVRHCAICFNLTEAKVQGESGDAVCNICADRARDHSIICVIEQPKDLLQLESANVFRGVYHVLLGRIAPLENLAPSDLTIAQLLDRLKSVPETTPPNPVKANFILATNPTMEGDGTALYIQQEIAFIAPHIQVTRLARGGPAGALKSSIPIKRSSPTPSTAARGCEGEGRSKKQEGRRFLGQLRSSCFLLASRFFFPRCFFPPTDPVSC